jgi:putative nucleotidyltransferase with HDIG domain
MPPLRPPTLDEVTAQAVCLPCAPTLLPRLVAALQKAEGTADEIESIIRLDTALTAATLRLANSAFYSGSSVDTVAEAIMRLGQREIYRLAALALVCRWDGGQMRSLNWEPGDFTRHTLCTALAAEALAEATERLEPQSAYTAGLVCDVGKLALAHGCAELYGAVRTRCEETGCTWEKAETDVFGYTHAQAGAKMLQAWRFPEVLIHAVRFQDRPEEAPEASHALLGNLCAARYLAASMGPGVGEDAYRVAVHGDFLLRQGFTSEILEAALPVVLERAAARLGDKLSTGAVTI